ncbi:MAG: polyketide cyclase [Candidatus Sericytochromatia bacterium]
MNNNYHFITNWVVKGTVEEVFNIILDAKSLVEWWPSVYLDIKTVNEPDEKGKNGRFSLLTKGFLPYTLKWDFIPIEIIKNEKIELIAEGDFSGRGIWTFEQDNDFVKIKYDWKITANKPILKMLSFLLKPIFSANHNWAMDMGLESLKLEILRRRKNSENENISPPPPPSKFDTKGLIFIFISILSIIILLKKLRRKTCKKSCKKNKK